MSNCPRLDDYAAPTSTYLCDDHLQVCSICRTAVSELAALRALSTQLDDGLPSEKRVADVRKRLLNRAASQRRFSYGPWLAMAALLCIAALSASLWFQQTPTPSGRIIEEKNARYAMTHNAGDEQIHLQNGTITIEVNHLKPGQRFRVITEDAADEVLGTAFRVRAHHGRLQGVTVLEGLVEVRPAGKPAQLLEKRQRWTASPSHAFTEVR
ncbi:MAG: FecR domain-containing protein, partial [Myxococcota bacterium]|nr:FecR domain-containing protein [Myxococcota bacterium]